MMCLNPIFCPWTMLGYNPWYLAKIGKFQKLMVSLERSSKLSENHKRSEIKFPNCYLPNVNIDGII